MGDLDCGGCDCGDCGGCGDCDCCDCGDCDCDCGDCDCGECCCCCSCIHDCCRGCFNVFTCFMCTSAVDDCFDSCCDRCCEDCWSTSDRRDWGQSVDTNTGQNRTQQQQRRRFEEPQGGQPLESELTPSAPSEANGPFDPGCPPPAYDDVVSVQPNGHYYTPGYDADTPAVTLQPGYNGNTPAITSQPGYTADLQNTQV